MSLFREPDAGNLPVRFDEREQETEPSQTGLRRRHESLVSSHRETKATAPVLDSTRDCTHRAFRMQYVIKVALNDVSRFGGVLLGLDRGNFNGADPGCSLR